MPLRLGIRIYNERSYSYSQAGRNGGTFGRLCLGTIALKLDMIMKEIKGMRKIMRIFFKAWSFFSYPLDTGTFSGQEFEAKMQKTSRFWVVITSYMLIYTIITDF